MSCRTCEGMGGIPCVRCTMAEKIASLRAENEKLRAVAAAARQAVDAFKAWDDATDANGAVKLGVSLGLLDAALRSVNVEIDWTPFDKWSEDTCTCRCGRTFRSHAKTISSPTGDMRLISRKTCPGCGGHELTRVSSDPEVMTIGGTERMSTDEGTRNKGGAT